MLGMFCYVKKVYLTAFMGSEPHKKVIFLRQMQISSGLDTRKGNKSRLSMR